jgi:hypothetical protein
MAASASYNSNIVNQRAQSPFTVASGGTVYAGTFAQLNAAGTYVAAGANGTNRKVVGEFVRDLVAATADTIVAVREGDVLKANYASDPVVVGDVGATVYVYDDQTVCHTAGSNAKAGIFLGFDVVQPTLCRVRCTVECT